MNTSAILNLIDVRFNTYPSRILKASIISAKSLWAPSVDSLGISAADQVLAFWKKSTGLSLSALFPFLCRSADHCMVSMLGAPAAMAIPMCQMFSFGRWSCSSPQSPCQPPWSSSRQAGISQPRYLGSNTPDPNINHSAVVMRSYILEDKEELLRNEGNHEEVWPWGNWQVRGWLWEGAEGEHFCDMGTWGGTGPSGFTSNWKCQHFPPHLQFRKV